MKLRSLAPKVWEEKPKDFSSEIKASGAFIKVEEKILLVQRNFSKEEGGTWEIPGGKLEEGESPLTCIYREVEEETGIIDCPTVTLIGTLYFQKKISYEFHIFEFLLQGIPSIKLSEEHLDHQWISIEEAKNLPLISGEERLFAFYNKMRSQ